jgi:hypothetical protein
MCCVESKSVLEIVQSIMTCLGIFLGGSWVLYLFITQRENQPRIEFSADIIFHKKIGDWWIVELLAYVENKGKTQHKLYNLDFELSSIESKDEVNLAKIYNNQVHFPTDILKGTYLREGIGYFFIEPGVKSKFSYVARVPVKAEAVIFHTWFNYNDKKRSHTAEATKAVPGQ